MSGVCFLSYYNLLSFDSMHVFGFVSNKSRLEFISAFVKYVPTNVCPLGWDKYAELKIILLHVKYNVQALSMGLYTLHQ